ncbi:MASE1 domain-containing protein [Klebsiella aerogenes]|uniref:MASE1 domain-containing protein n=2 Tax=Klebsiella aerogenes TaxID=548 RepID=A0AAP9QSE7_KLEAE|nr:MASE1 domain-containing protein [Klebsiella aerogenes]EIV2085251.1 MASE1 domain-containing protein [Klebsiella aerogenes]EIV2086942.1 MASE1 domain-containing protein [Klebsiella aerogenes]EIW9213492.1 MASE1 domain-containing protein [Klebsiella aerogenes]EIW9215183.1 MASE1 domain-containing protein [Klebsiella aerogenes]EKU4513672.1 MASE1 domain-containing protein [Klebsiella aerogenes]
MPKRIQIAEKNYLPALIIWPVIYLILAFISLKLDDPQNRVAMVWFPAGAAVSAFLSLPRRFWPAMYIVLFAARAGMDVLMRHSSETSLILSLISVSGDVTVALAVQHYSRGQDDFRKVCVWLISTLIISALAGMAAAGWLSSRHPVSFADTIALWWAANVSGNIVATTVLTGLTWEPARKATGDIVKTLAGVLLVAVVAILIFSSPSGEESRAGLIYGLACLPVLLTAVVPVIAGAQAGALAFLVLSIVVVSFSWHQTGPFFIKGLDPGEPLLLAQGYLSGTAILTIFVRLLLRLPDKLNGPGRKQMHHEETAFRMDIRSGRIDWDLQGTPVLTDTVAHLPDRKILLQSVDTAVRQQLTSRWEQAIRGLPVGGSLIFRLTLPGDEHVMICERGLFFLPGTTGGFLVGYWLPASGPVSVIRPEDH